MNERIKQFIEQAQKVVGYTDGGYTEIKALDPEKFALLIVRECLTFVEPMPGSGDIDDLALEAARDGIKEHFGVKE